MPEFGLKSQKKLETCDERIQLVLKEAIKYLDFTILDGYKSEEVQNEQYNKKLTNDKYPNSLHNTIPSKAVDIALWHKEPPHVRWEELFSFYFLGGFILGIASQMNINLKWGGDLEQNYDITDSDYLNLIHFELIDEE